MLRKSILAVAAGLGLAVLTAGSALAGVSTTPDFTDANLNPVAGYYAFAEAGQTFTHVNAYTGLQYNANQLTAFPATDIPAAGSPVDSPVTVPVNGAGVQLCNDNTGAAFQAGAVYLGGNQFAVLWATGTFTANSPKVRNNGDLCEDGLIANPAVASVTEFGSVSVNLDAIPYGHTIEDNLLYNNSGKTLADCPRGDDAEVVASDITTGNHEYDACLRLPAHEGFNESADGIEGDTTGLSGPADVQLDGNAHWTLTDLAGDHGFGDTSPDWTAVPVDALGTLTGGTAGQSLLLAGSIHDGNWSALEGTPTG